MSDWSLCAVSFVTASPGPGSANLRQIPLPLEAGRPPRLLTDPTLEQRGDWLFVERDGGRFVYRRVTSGVAHP